MQKFVDNKVSKPFDSCAELDTIIILDLSVIIATADSMSLCMLWLNVSFKWLLQCSCCPQ